MTAPSRRRQWVYYWSYFDWRSLVIFDLAENVQLHFSSQDRGVTGRR